MLKLIINKNDIKDAIVLLAQVSNLKSLGAVPAESSCIQFTQTTMTITNTNEANAIVINNIPIEVIDGNIGEILEQGIMVDTKKLSNIIKGAKEKITLNVDKEAITIQTGSKRFTLNTYNVDPKNPIPITIAATPVNIKEFGQLMSNADVIVSKVENAPHLCGSLIHNNQLYATDRTSAIFVKDAEVNNKLPDGLEKIFITPDLFATCLKKTTIEEGTLGITEDGRRIALVIDNVTLYKSVLGKVFPQEKMVEVINKVLRTDSKDMVIGTINVNEMVDKFKEYQAIVEAPYHYISLHTDGSLRISADNISAGAAGEVVVSATNLQIPEEIGESFGGMFLTSSILLIQELFGNEKEAVIRMNISNVNNKQFPNIMSIDTPKLLYFCMPKTA